MIVLAGVKLKDDISLYDNDTFKMVQSYRGISQAYIDMHNVVDSDFNRKLDKFKLFYKRYVAHAFICSIMKSEMYDQIKKYKDLELYDAEFDDLSTHQNILDVIVDGRLQHYYKDLLVGSGSKFDVELLVVNNMDVNSEKYTQTLKPIHLAYALMYWFYKNYRVNEIFNPYTSFQIYEHFLHSAAHQLCIMSMINDTNFKNYYCTLVCNENVHFPYCTVGYTRLKCKVGFISILKEIDDFKKFL